MRREPGTISPARSRDSRERAAAIMSMLAASPELSFTDMRDTLNMTDGNLTTHIRLCRKQATFQSPNPFATIAR